MHILNWDKTGQKKLTRHLAQDFDRQLFKKVDRIVQAVRLKGDGALRRFTREFDGLDISPKRLRVTQGDINRAYEKVNIDFLPFLKQITENARTYYQRELNKSFKIKHKDGSYLGKKFIPLERVGIYIPGGQAPLVSTVYMTALPAQVAGVKEIVLATPPNRETGEINPHILVVADLLGIKEIYRMGGAQAIAALAWGTKTVKRVDKIVGPGNPYVTEAKRQVYGFVDIDMVAGPSEVVILADSKADPNLVTCDLLAQAEHAGGIPILVTNSKKLAEQIHKRVEGGYAVIVKSLKEAVRVCDEIAPEHLQIMTSKPQSMMRHIRNAGAVFLGPWTPAVVGDFVAGPSHVLPTGGTARYFSPLGVGDFIKGIQYMHYTKEALSKVRDHIYQLTEIEGLMLHRISCEARFIDHTRVGGLKKGETSEGTSQEAKENSAS
jgi:histidinol dehydrogenase